MAFFPSIVFLILLYGIPRSSRWLVTTNQTDEASEVLKLMGSPNSEAELKEIVESIHLERGIGQEPLFQKKIQTPDLSRHFDRLIQSARRHQRDPVLLQLHLCFGWV